MDLTKFPRRRYTVGYTPIEKMENLTKLLGGPELYIKRDDLLGLAGGGNKTRKLEFVVAEALAAGADTLITCGAVQSNHCRLTLAAAKKEGLNCRLVLEERVPGSYDPEASGNNFLFKLLGVEKIRVVKGGSDMVAEMEKEAADLADEGRKGFVVLGGASSPTGALGYVSCAQEFLTQAFEMDTRFDHFVCASGSAGTHAGVVTGIWGSNANVPVTGISVSRKTEPQTDLVHALVKETAAKLGVAQDIPRDKVVVFDQYVGPGYSLPTESMAEAVMLFARHEAILLDPVYTGKTAAGLIDLCRQGYFKKGEKVIFLHTGGSPGLYHYRDYFPI